MTQIAQTFDPITDRDEPAPESAQRFFRLAKESQTLEDQSRFYIAALHIHPGYVDALNNFAIVLKFTGQLDVAIAYQRKACALRPSDGDLWCGLGRSLMQAQRFEESGFALEMATRLSPENFLAWQNRAHLAYNTGAVEIAERLYRKALELKPGEPTVRWDLGLMLRMQGRYEEAYEHDDARLEFLHPGVLKRPIPLWCGEPLEEKTLWLYGDQGFGDMIMCSRFLPQVAEEAEHVVLDLPVDLHNLLWPALAYNGIEIRPHNAPMPAADFHLPLMSLFSRLRVSLDDLPPPLSMARSTVSIPILDHGRDRAFRVGVIWGGDTGNPGDDRRSLKLNQVVDLAAIPGVDLYSLQVGPQAAAIGERGALAIMQDLAPYIRDFSDTARAIEFMDLIVSVDTAVAHLAGTMGKPVYVLLAAPNDWRWMMEREDSPWYPSARLFRQDRPGDWSGALSRLHHAVAGLAQLHNR